MGKPYCTCKLCPRHIVKPYSTHHLAELLRVILPLLLLQFIILLPSCVISFPTNSVFRTIVKGGPTAIFTKGPTPSKQATTPLSPFSQAPFVHSHFPYFTYDSSSLYMNNKEEHDADNIPATTKENTPLSSSYYHRRSAPCLAIITEPDACDSDDRMVATWEAISKAVIASHEIYSKHNDNDNDDENHSFISLVSIRLHPPSSSSKDVYQRAFNLIQRLLQLRSDLQRSKLTTVSTTTTSNASEMNSGSKPFQVVCSSDWIELALEAKADGIHFKEKHLSQIPKLRQRLLQQQSAPAAATTETTEMIIGTSTHSIESAKESFDKYQPDYYFVGTCFLTASHPEKTNIEDLEGPTLPGKVKAMLQEESIKQRNKSRNDIVTARTAHTQDENHKKSENEISSCPRVYAIGGIDEKNCHIPTEGGADGVATIRAILQANDPAETVRAMYNEMRCVVDYQNSASTT